VARISFCERLKSDADTLTRLCVLPQKVYSPPGRTRTDAQGISVMFKAQKKCIPTL
jgi:hypothetical protein